MKKVYSKITRNRKSEYQIETSIYKVNDSRRIIKKALSSKSEEHINNMFNYYNANMSNGMLCPCKLIESGVVEFDYIEGDNFLSLLLDAIESKNIELFDQLAEDYKKLVQKYFGLENEYSKCLDTIIDGANVDFSFDNIVKCDEKYVVIDYEWILNGISLEFIVFRAVHATVVKYGDVISSFIELENYYKKFGIKIENIDAFIEKNQQFNDYVYGSEYSYNKAVKKYEKYEKVIAKDLTTTDNFAQIFTLLKEDYTEDDSVRIPVRDKIFNLKYEILIGGDIKQIRIDPSVENCVCKIKELYVYNNGYKKDITDIKHNGYRYKDIIVFCDDKPQIIIENNEFDGFDKLFLNLEIETDKKVTLKEMQSIVKSKESDDYQNYASHISELSTELHEKKCEIETLKHDKETFKEMSRQLQKRLNETMAENKMMKVKFN